MLALYQRVLICRTFPAYTLESAGQANARDVLQALQLLSTARQIQESSST